MARDIIASSWRVALGLVIGTFLGIAVGFLTGRIKFTNILLGPIIQMIRSLPPVAIIPLIIIWFGIGDTAKIFSISFAVFFPNWINTHIGAENIPITYLWCAKLFKANKVKIFLRVMLPASAQHIIAGIRTGIPIAFIMVYVSELAGASSGLGYQISISHLAYRIDKMIAALIVLGFLGGISDYLITSVIKNIFPWTKLQDNRL